jgi:ketosteroid isomerase-like protein
MTGKSMTDAPIADQLVTATEQADWAALGRLYAPEAVIWHNVDDREETPAENANSLRTLLELIDGVEYAVRRRIEFDGGFLQQSTVTCKLKDGGRFPIPTCVICLTRNGQIVRLEEYFDSGTLNGLFAAIGAAPDQFRQATT